MTRKCFYCELEIMNVSPYRPVCEACVGDFESRARREALEKLLEIDIPCEYGQDGGDLRMLKAGCPTICREEGYNKSTGRTQKSMNWQGLV